MKILKKCPALILFILSLNSYAQQCSFNWQPTDYTDNSIVRQHAFFYANPGANPSNPPFIQMSSGSVRDLDDLTFISDVDASGNGNINFSTAKNCFADVNIAGSTGNFSVNRGNIFSKNSIYVDNAAQNNGIFNTAALIFGATATTGESIASRRSGTTNLFGLDFYTSGQNRMTISNNGKVNIGILSAPDALLTLNSSSIDNSFHINGGTSSDGLKSSNLYMQALTGGNLGYTSLNYNVSFNGTDLLTNGNKTGWKLAVDQRNTSDNFSIVNYALGSAAAKTMLNITPDGNTAINGTLLVSGTGAISPSLTTGIKLGNTSNYSWLQGIGSLPLALNPLGTSYVAIGFEPGTKGAITPLLSAFKLAVNGKILCTELLVKNGSAWPDYVFAKNYKLMPLDSVAKFTAANQHLPEVPSAREVEENGFNTGEMNAVMLKKIEELTLYLIEQKQQIEALEAKVKQLSR